MFKDRIQISKFLSIQLGQGQRTSLKVCILKKLSDEIEINNSGFLCLKDESRFQNAQPMVNKSTSMWPVSYKNMYTRFHTGIECVISVWPVILTNDNRNLFVFPIALTMF